VAKDLSVATIPTGITPTTSVEPVAKRRTEGKCLLLSGYHALLEAQRALVDNNARI
jgi:hypothetical protein